MDDLEMEFDPQMPKTPRGCDAENLIVISTPDDPSCTTPARGYMGITPTYIDIRTGAVVPPPTKSNTGSMGPSPSFCASGRPPPSSTDRVNPFEREYLNNLACTMWSPSVFDNMDVTTPPLGKIAWNVDEMARLFPKDIEESPSSHMNPYPLNSSEEKKAQEVINQFFSRGPIAPSPSPLMNAPKSKFNFAMDPNEGVKSTSESWTNTEITLPKVLPKELEEVLKPFCQTAVSSETFLVCEVPLQLLGNGKPGSSAVASNLSFNSVRRRLELSFGELSEPSSPSKEPEVPYGDPFVGNHNISSPGAGSEDDDEDIENSGTSAELVERFERCEFTPTRSSGMKRKHVMVSPDITPIRGFGNPSNNRQCFSRGKDPRAKMAKMFLENPKET